MSDLVIITTIIVMVILVSIVILKVLRAVKYFVFIVPALCLWRAISLYLEINKAEPSEGFGYLGQQLGSSIFMYGYVFLFIITLILCLLGISKKKTDNQQKTIETNAFENEKE